MITKNQMSHQLEYEFSGVNLMSKVLKFLNSQGYRDGEGYNYLMDGAAGWADWHYWLYVAEDPNRPVKDKLDEMIG